MAFKFNPFTGELDKVNTDAPTKAEWNQDGFENLTDSTISFVDGTRTFTIEPASTEFSFYSYGVKFTKSSAQTVVIDDTEGLWFIYFDSAGTLTASQTPWDFVSGYAFVAVLYWDADLNSAIGIGEERHGMSMSPATHAYLHLNVGAVWNSGYTPSVTVDGDGSLDAHAEIQSISAGVTYDEDIQLSSAEQTSYEMWYKDGASVDWRKEDVSAAAVAITTDRPDYNQFTGGAWQRTEVSNNKFTLTHVFATNSIESTKGILVMGENEYATKKAAQDGALSEITDLTTGALPTPEFVALATFIIECKDSYTNAYNARLVSTSDGDDFVDFRESEKTGVGAVATDHGNLAGLSDDDHTQYLLVDGTRAMTGNLDMGDNNIVDAHYVGVGTSIFQQDVNGITTDAHLVSVVDSEATHVAAAFAEHGNTAIKGVTTYGARSRGTAASPTIVQDGDNIWDMIAIAYDGTDYAQVARIDMEIDGTPGNNDMPGRIKFSVSPDGGQTPADALLISQDKSVKFFGNLTDGTNTVTMANIKTAYDHSQDNTQAHSDYLLNNVSDVFSGIFLTLSSGSGGTSGLKINNSALAGDPAIQLQLSGSTKALFFVDDSDSDKVKIGAGSSTASGMNLAFTVSDTTCLTNFTVSKASFVQTAAVAFSTGDATPAVNKGNSFQTANVGATTITDFDGGSDGQVIFLKVNDANTTIADNANINTQTGGNFIASSGDRTAFFSYSGVWEEFGRATAARGYVSVTTTADATASAAEYDIFDEDNYAAFTSTANVTSNLITFTQADGRFTVAEDGIYVMMIKINATAASTGAVTVKVKDGGTAFYTDTNFYIHTSVDPQTMTIPLARSLSANDYINVTVDGGSNVVAESGCTFTMYKL